jgi:hypothetical protein
MNFQNYLPVLKLLHASEMLLTVVNIKYNYRLQAFGISQALIAILIVDLLIANYFSSPAFQQT